MTPDRPSPDTGSRDDRDPSRSRAIGQHVRSNVVGYVALFVALTGGTAYALEGSNTVFSDDIVNGEVKSADIANPGVNSADLASSSVGTGKIINGGVGAPDLASGSVNSAKVVNGSLRGVDILNGSVANQDLAPSARSGPGARARATSPQSFATNVTTTVSLDTEDFDTGNMYQPPGDSITATRTGTYLLTGLVIFAAGGGSSRQVNLSVNGVAIAVASATPSTSSTGVNPTGIARLVAGDAITMSAFQNSGGNLSTVSNINVGRAFLAAWRLGP